MDADLPKGYTNVTPYLVVTDVPGLINFLQEVLDAEVITEPIERDDGSVMHAEVRIGNALVMMGEAMNDGPPIPAMLYVYVDNADERYRRGLEAGGISLMEPMDADHGDRYGGVQDPYGNQWYMATHFRDVSQAE